jgi:hypothetical protein
MKFIATAAILSGLAIAGGIAPALAQPAFPPPPYEGGPMGPPPGPPGGYIVEPGHYSWVNGRYVWFGRHWIARRVGYGHFVPGHWGPGGRWIPEHWRR